MADKEITQEDWEAFQAFQKARQAGKTPEIQNGATCNQCPYDSREPAEPEEGEPAAERDDAEDVAGDTLAALDHNASTGHHVSVRVAGDVFQVAPRQS
jgi:hypothetical protein